MLGSASFGCSFVFWASTAGDDRKGFDACWGSGWNSGTGSGPGSGSGSGAISYRSGFEALLDCLEDSDRVDRGSCSVRGASLAKRRRLADVLGVERLTATGAGSGWAGGWGVGASGEASGDSSTGRIRPNDSSATSWRLFHHRQPDPGLGRDRSNYTHPAPRMRCCIRSSRPEDYQLLNVLPSRRLKTHCPPCCAEC